MNAAVNAKTLGSPMASRWSSAWVSLIPTEGGGLWDRDGTRYLEATSSLWYANIGHGRARMADAIAAQIRKLDAYSTFGDQANEPAIELANRLASVSPVDYARVSLTT